VEHREKVRQGFTAEYGVARLVWYEAHETRENAFLRERRLKKWNRLWKLELIEKTNPGWRDLYDELSPLG
jgi:predicted GIY-YIG superfamily endonuclease